MWAVSASEDTARCVPGASSIRDGGDRDTERRQGGAAQGPGRLAVLLLTSGAGTARPSPVGERRPKGTSQKVCAVASETQVYHGFMSF